MVMAQTLFAELQRQRPCDIDVLAPAWCRPLLSRMPEVRQALDLPFGHGELKLRQRRAAGRALRGGYDRAFVLPNSLKSALIPFWAGVPVRTGWRGEMRYGLLNDVRKLDKERYPLMVQRFVALALDADAPPPPLETIQPPRLRVDSDAVAAARADQRLADDRPVAEQIIEALPEAQRGEAAILAGATSLEQAVDLLSVTDAVVSNDSGLMHIAAALGRPLVAVYGSTSPGFTPPLGEAVAIERLGLECSPCFQRECPLGHLNCLRQLEPDRVIQALARLPGVPR